MGRPTSTLVWNYLYKNGPTRPRDLPAKVKTSRMGVYQALLRLEGMGLVYREGERAWYRTYNVVPGALPPNDLRGHTPASRAALAKGRKDARTFGECALAECWNLLPFSRASGD